MDDTPDPDDDDLASIIGDPRVYEAMMQECAEDSGGESDESADPDGEPSSRREAKYRVRAREAEGQVETQRRVITELQERIERMQRADVERVAAVRLAEAGDIWVSASLDDMLDSDGDIDLKRVDEVIGELLNRRPHWGVPSPRRHGGLLSGASNQPEPWTSSWQAAFGRSTAS